jgi:phage shock protein E
MTTSRKALFALLLLAGSTLLRAEPVYIDVRTVQEYSADHIDGDLNLPLAEIDVEALAERFGTDAELVLYCRTGNRSGQAMAKLVAAGFSNVSNAGGIDDIRKLRNIALQSGAAPGNAPVAGAAAQ